MARFFVVRHVILFALLLSLFVFLIPRTSAGQSKPLSLEEFCSENSRSGAIQLETSFPTSVPDTEIGLTANITNQNVTPVTDGIIFVRVYKASPTAAGSIPTIVDQFSVPTGINLLSGSSTSRSFTWRVPLGIQESALHFAASLISDQQLWVPQPSVPTRGAPGSADVSIDGGNVGVVAFDKSKILVGNTRYDFADAPLELAGINSLPLSAGVTNSTRAGVEGRVTWKIYPWELTPSLAPSGVGTSSVRIHPGLPISVRYSAEDSGVPLQYIEGRLAAGNNTDVIALRVARSGESQVHLGGVGVTNYPLIGESSVIACLRNVPTGQSVGRIDVKVTKTGLSGSVEAIGSYEGPLTETVVIPLEQVQVQAMRDFGVVAQLFVNNRLIHSVSASYSCSALGMSDCPQNFFGQPGQSTPTNILITLIAILIVIAVYAIIWGKRHGVWNM